LISPQNSVVNDLFGQIARRGRDIPGEEYTIPPRTGNQVEHEERIEILSKLYMRLCSLDQVDDLTQARSDKSLMEFRIELWLASSLTDQFQLYLLHHWIDNL